MYIVSKNFWSTTLSCTTPGADLEPEVEGARDLAACGQREGGVPPSARSAELWLFLVRLRAMRPPQLGVVGVTSDELDSETESKVAEGSLTASFSLQRLDGGSPSSHAPSCQPFERTV